ncbi:MAG: hypothetical protein ACK2U1_06160, partial [Anaerolineales bacterium]
MSQRFWFLFALVFGIIFLAACSAGAPEDMAETIIEKEGESVIETVEVDVGVEAPAAEEPVEEAPAEEEAQPMPSATLAPQATAVPTQAPVAPQLSTTPLVETRLVEVEWPENLHLGDSDVVRMALIPSEKG